MVVIKRVLCREFLRKVPEQFSWVDHRLVRDRRIVGRSAEILVLGYRSLQSGTRSGGSARVRPTSSVPRRATWCTRPCRSACSKPTGRVWQLPINLSILMMLLMTCYPCKPNRKPWRVLPMHCYC